MLADRKRRIEMARKTRLQTSVETLEKAFQAGTFDPAYVQHVSELANDAEKTAKQAKNTIQNFMSQHFSDMAARKFSEKGSDTGTISMFVGDSDSHVLKVIKTKKVEWDQKHLTQVISTNPNAAKFINSFHKVSEDDYKRMSDVDRDVIDPGRTVKSGTPSFKIEKRKETGE